MFAVTHIQKDGLRTLIHGAQGRYMHETRAAAGEYLRAMLANNGRERLEGLYGDLSTLRVDPFECYDHGDPAGIYVDEDTP